MTEEYLEQMTDTMTEADIEILDKKYLTFVLGNEEYGIDINDVKEIVGIQKITDVPDMPPFIKGVINLRGKIIPVMDIRIRFCMNDREYNDRTCIIVVNIENKEIGLIVDNVSEVLDIPIKNIENSSSVSGSNENYINGYGKVEDSVKILLDIQKLLMGELLEQL
ncbi:chemotaxis protein CheW [candidate division KSB1 bacterium]